MDRREVKRQMNSLIEDFLKDLSERMGAGDLEWIRGASESLQNQGVVCIIARTANDDNDYLRYFQDIDYVLRSSEPIKTMYRLDLLTHQVKEIKIDG